MAIYNYDIGNLTSTPVRKNGSIKITGGSNDVSSDVYEFKIGSTSNINLALTKMGYGNYANLYLYRDNGDGSFGSGDQLISSSYQPGSERDETINTRANAGTYFAEVKRDYYSPSSNNVTYDLALSATSITGPNNLLTKEIVVGTLSRDLTYSGNAVNDDTYNGNTSDTYFFSLGSNARVDISLTGLNNDADIPLIQDINKNGIVDTSEVIKSSTIRGTSSEKISGINLQGDYFLQVNQYNSGDTGYTLTFDYTGI